MKLVAVAQDQNTYENNQKTMAAYGYQEKHDNIEITKTLSKYKGGVTK